MKNKKLKALVAAGLAAALVAGMTGCSGTDTAMNGNSTQTAAGAHGSMEAEVATRPTREATEEFIGIENAKAVILKDLGVQEAYFLEKETELDDLEYEFEVVVGDYEYEYEIHAKTGAVVEKEKEFMDEDDKEEFEQRYYPGKKKLTIEEAKAIILADLGVEKAYFEEIEEDDDHEYEFEVISGDYEYEYDINYYTGKIVDKDVDRLDDDDRREVENKKENQTAKPAEKISFEKAKAIALADLGIKNAKLVDSDYDDGEYEFEFWADGVEYEYEINARTGKIVDKDVEYDDDWYEDRYDDDDDDDRDDD